MPKETQPQAGATPTPETSESEHKQAENKEAAYKYASRSVPPDDSYADGAASIAGGRNVVKIDLYRVVGFDKQDKKEVRTVSHRLVLPISALSELMKLMQGYGEAYQKVAQASSRRSAANGQK